MSDRPTRRSGRALAHTLVAALLLSLLSAPAAIAGPTEDQAEVAAAAWLVGAYADGEVTTGGGLTDVILALGGAGAAPDTIAAARTDLEALAADYVTGGSDVVDEGPLAKAVLGIATGGGDPTDVDGQDLVAQLRALRQTQGGDAGRFDDASVFTQALAVMALATTADGVAADSRMWLVDRRCPDGGWTFGLTETAGISLACATPGGGDVDTTALVLQALLGADEADITAAVDGAVAWLADQQAADGSFGDNANSTGLAAQALRAVGESEAADAGAAFITTLQIPDGQPEAGAFRFTADSDGSLLLATTQGILAFGAPALPQITPPAGGPEGPCEPASAGVTVVVDLTFFDGGEILQGCAPGDPGSGLDALRGAGFDVITQSSDFGEFVCAIEGMPELACDQPFEGQFWGYFAGNADGTWTSYQVGADTSDPAPGAVEGWAYSDGSAPTTEPPGSVVQRLAGADRIDTAIQISRAAFPDSSATGAVLTRADAFADALAGTPLAAAAGGPLLTSTSAALPGEVAAELTRAVGAGSTVYVLGGRAALDEDVVTAVEELGFTVRRVAGPDRFTTATAIADAVADLRGGLTRVLITTGSVFADALSAGAAAAVSADAAVLLTGDGTPHPAVEAFLDANGDLEQIAVGGPAAAAHPAAVPIVGQTRDATAVRVAEVLFGDGDGTSGIAPAGPAPTVVGIARNDDFADALAGGVSIAALGGPLLIVPRDQASQVVIDYLCSGDVQRAVVYGGPSAVGADASLAIADAITGESCS